MLARMWKKGNPSTLLVGVQTGKATVENNMEFPQKLKMLCTAKENIIKMKKDSIVWENIVANDTLGQGFDLQNI